MIKLILSLSLSGSILAVLIFAVKPFIRNRMSKSVQYYIWLVVLLRLVIPFSFEESIMNRVFYSDGITKTAVTQEGKQLTNEASINPQIPPVKEETPSGTETAAHPVPVSNSKSTLSIIKIINSQ